VRTVIVAFVIALCSCKDAGPRAVKPPTVAEAETFGKDFAAKLSPCDAAAVDRVVDVDLLIARSVRGKATDEFVAGFKKGFGSFGNMFCKQLDGIDAKLTYLRTQQENGAPRPLLRQISEGGVNYYWLELDKHNGTIKLADLYVFMSGEKMSDTLRGMLETMGRNGLSAGPKIKQIREHMLAKRWEEANKLWQTLPANLRAAKAVKLIELQIASELGDDAYLASLTEYTRAFPNDPSLALIAIDRALLRKQYDVALQYFVDLDTRVGGDAYLDILRADTLTAAGKPEEALAAAKRATEREATMVDAWWTLLSLQASTKRYTDALASVEVLRDKFDADVTTDTLAGDDRFAPLVESPEYAAWAGKQ
jgi:tetratricopeptide (TPR) repeat protein